MLLAPDLRIVGATDAYLAATKTRRADIVGRNVFDVFPENPNDPSATDQASLRRSLERVIATRHADTMPTLKYALQRADGRFEDHHWQVVNSPILDDADSLALILNAVEDVTDKVIARARMRELAAPVVTVRPRVLLLPIIGWIDGERSELMMQTVLDRVADDGARAVILDVAGAGVIDTAVASSLIKMAAAARVLGAIAVVTGIGPAAAKTLVQLGVEIGALHTCGRLSEGIDLAERLIADGHG